MLGGHEHLFDLGIGNVARVHATDAAAVEVNFQHDAGCLLSVFAKQLLQHVNDKLHGFGNALWWAWMNVTTVGAEIFAVTAIGKVITILLPTLGMMMFPIFTTYILQEYTHKKESDQ